MSSNQSNGPRRNFFGPILLIVVGLLFLGSNLGVIPGEGWDIIRRFWPLLLIIAGINDLVRREGIAWPILLIAAGVFFLLNNLGPQVWISWTQLIQLWPVLLIAAGIDLVFKGESVWMSVIGVVMTIVLFAGAVWMVREGVQVSAEYSRISEDLPEGVEDVVFDLNLGAGELILDDLGPDQFLVSGSITPDKKEVELNESNGQIEYSLYNRVPDFFPHTGRWELSTSSQVGLAVAVQNGAGEILLSLKNSDLRSLHADQGVGRLVVRLPETDSEDIYIQQAVGVIKVYIPEGMKVAVDAKNGLSKVTFPSDFELEEGYYTTPKTSAAAADLVIVIEQAVGFVTVEYYR